MKLTDFKALTFDCYGTLIDWERGILDVLRPWVNRHHIEATDDHLLELFAAAEAAAQAETPNALYPDILRAVHRRLALELGIAASDEDTGMLAESAGKWPPFPDTVEALKQLKQSHKLVIVSNIDRASFARTNAQLEVEFDAIVTAEEVGAYKPDHHMFQRAFEVLEGIGIKRHEILHVAQSLYHDHVPAKALGLTTAWIDRRHGRAGGGATVAPDNNVRPDIVAPSLAAFAEMMES